MCPIFYRNVYWVAQRVISQLYKCIHKVQLVKNEWNLKVFVSILAVVKCYNSG